ncbi:MAG: insulinase family protein [Polyangiaceae bacterium]|nr:insulinase family protein [Polyangiaceae bacterium]
MRALVVGAALLLAGCAATPEPVVPDAPDPPPPPASFVAPVAPEPVTPDAKFREGPPAPGPAAPFVAPKVTEARLKNGVRVLLVERHELPLVSVRLVAAGGASDAAPGVADLASSLVLSGTKRRSAVEISDALGALGARHAVFADDDACGVSLDVLAEKLPAALDVVGESIVAPTFPKDELERQRTRTLTFLTQAKDSAGRQLWYETLSTLYPAGHPYATPVVGTEAGVRAAKAGDLARFHARSWTPDRVTVGVVGDVDRATLLPLLERALGGLAGRSGAPRPPVTPPAFGDKDARVVIVDRPGASQTNLQVAGRGIARGTPDFEALLVMNTILGGSFSSRLNMNLREKHAYTYGASSRFDARRGVGPFVAGGAIVRDATGKALKEIFAELDRIRDEPVTADELELAKSAIIERLPAQIETNAATASFLASLPLYGLPLDELDRRVARVRAVTREDVQRVARRALDPRTMRVVMVGDHDKIAADVAALGLGATRRVGK